MALAEKTTFNIGGPARYYAEVNDLDNLHEALSFAQEHHIPWFVLSGGSNVLFREQGYDGLIIHITAHAVHYKGEQVTTDAGAALSDTIRASAERELSGWESMCGIPGTIGGAVRGNAGAFGTEVKDVLVSARALDTQTGEIREFSNKECSFDYRTSFFKQNPDWIVLSAAFKLTHNSQGNPAATCAETVAERNKRHLQNVQCAGSFFKNPVCPPAVVRQFESDKGVASKGSKVPAGWLIEQCGLKGTRVGDALCSEQHPNYIVNTGNATATDVLTLRDTIKSAVKEQFGVALEEEVTIV